MTPRSHIHLNLFSIATLLMFTLSHCAGQVSRRDDNIVNLREKARKAEIAVLGRELQGRGISMGRKGLQGFLQRIAEPHALTPAAQKLIQQLGSATFAEREAAEESLAKIPQPPIDLLREATQSKNVEIVYRSKRILTNALTRQRQDLEKVLRAIERLRVSGLTKEIFRALPSVLRRSGQQEDLETVAGLFDLRSPDDVRLLNLARSALLETVVEDDLPWLKTMVDNQSSLRMLAIHTLAAKGLTSDKSVRKILDKLWTDGESEVRLAATESLLARGERDGLKRFVALLESDDVEVRIRAVNRLWDATGKYFAFAARGTAESRSVQVAAWRAWVEASGQDAEFRTDFLIARIWGRTLVASSLDDCVVEYDLAGNETWRIDLKDADVCWGTTNGERVVSSWNAKVLIVYAAGDGPPRELWRLEGRVEASPLPFGNILVMGDKGVSKYSSDGRKLWETQVIWKGKKRYPLDADRLPNGNIRVLFSKVFKPGPQFADTAVEIDERGDAIRELPYEPMEELLASLPNGNSLVRIEQPNRKIGKRIAECNSAGDVVWSFTSEFIISSAQRLPNGETLIASGREIQVIRNDGTVAWKFRPSVICGYIYRY